MYMGMKTTNRYVSRMSSIHRNHNISVIIAIRRIDVAYPVRSFRNRFCSWFSTNIPLEAILIMHDTTIRRIIDIDQRGLSTIHQGCWRIRSILHAIKTIDDKKEVEIPEDTRAVMMNTTEQAKILHRSFLPWWTIAEYTLFQLIPNKLEVARIVYSNESSLIL